MKRQETQPAPSSPAQQPREKDLSRRKFLQTAAIASMAAVTVPMAGIAQTGQTERQARPKDPLEIILDRYGSEFGQVNRIG